MKIAVVDDERPARKELISQILDVKPDCIVKEADSGGSALIRKMILICFLLIST